MQKISKTQFLELVELAVACRGAVDLLEEGKNQAENAFTVSLDAAIAEYVFWAYDAYGGFEGDPEKRYPGTIYNILTPWVEGYGKDQQNPVP